LRIVDQIADVRLGVVQLAHLGHRVQPILNGLSGTSRDELGHVVNLSQRHSQGAPDIPNRSPGDHGAKGGDLRRTILAVPRGEIVDHFLPAILRIVQIDIRHRDAPGVEKTLKDQAQAERLDIRDAQRVRDQAARTGPSAWPHEHFRFLLGPAYQVLVDEEIIVKAHVVDDRELIVQA